MDDLILSMIVAYNEYGDILGFDKNDIDMFIKKYDYLNNIGCNERGAILLWKNKYIDNKKFSDLMDVDFKDNKCYIVCKGFDDILNSDYESEIMTLSGEMEWKPQDVYENDVKQYWSDYNSETIKTIYNFCIKKGLTIEDETMTSENTIIENGDIFFNDVSLSEYIDDEGLDELKSELNIAICEAQESADQDEVYEKVKDAFVSEVGEYYWVDNRLYIEIDNSLINEAEEFLIDTYGDFEFENEEYGSLLYVLKEMEKFKFRVPDYNHIYGYIDNDLLNEYSQNRLEWEM